MAELFDAFPYLEKEGLALRDTQRGFYYGYNAKEYCGTGKKEPA